MKIFSWKVCGQLAALAERQMDAVLDRTPDILCLQEVSAGNYPGWCERLMGAGYSVVSAIDLVGVPYPEMAPPIRRRYFNLTATKRPIAPLAGLKYEDPDQGAVAFPEKYLAATVLVDGAPVEVHNADLPPSETLGLIKAHAFQAIRRRVDASPDRPLVLCGDFMTPRLEDDDGVTTWAASHAKYNDEWDAAERSILEHPVIRDVYREGHETGTDFAVSKVTRGTPHRYDHIYASPGLRTVEVGYLEDWLADKLSDHAPVEAELVLAD
jgi:endonuclease/exonuclease/phosphatase family metal-dependent hydrolase